MRAIYRSTDGGLVCWWEDDVQGLLPVPGPNELEVHLDISTSEFVSACRQSAGLGEDDAIGANYLHGTVEEATSSPKTPGTGVKVGHKAVECAAPVPRGTIADRIEALRLENGTPMNQPVSISELRQAEKGTLRRAVAAQR